MFTYLSLSVDNFPLYDSIVAPLLSLVEISSKPEDINNLSLPSTTEEVTSQKSDYLAVEEIIEYTRLLPRRLEFIKHRSGVYGEQAGHSVVGEAGQSGAGEAGQSGVGEAGRSGMGEGKLEDKSWERQPMQRADLLPQPAEGSAS